MCPSLSVNYWGYVSMIYHEQIKNISSVMKGTYYLGGGIILQFNWVTLFLNFGVLGETSTLQFLGEVSDS